MSIYKKLNKYTFLLLTVFILTSCYSEENWLTDNLEETGRSYPNIADINILNNQDQYLEGDVIEIDVSFWSEDPVNEIKLFHILENEDGDEIVGRTEVLSVSYSEANFSSETQTDHVVLDYEVPQISEDPTIITFIVEVENENGLTENNTESKNPTIRNIQVTAVP
ncbi:hypothetical protein [Rhodohalobacter sp.]|uniref:hypothetical protein n=1 Tax=Rhodohalobacter sp. TaxID=1974210 RepID=UPI003565E469